MQFEEPFTRTDARQPRPYDVPAGLRSARMLAVICSLFIVQAIALFVWESGENFDAEKAGAIGAGVPVAPVTGEVLIHFAQRKQRPPESSFSPREASA